MKRKKIIIWLVWIVIAITGIWGYLKIDTFLRIDECLDNGGSWNYETKKCEFVYSDEKQN